MADEELDPGSCRRRTGRGGRRRRSCGVSTVAVLSILLVGGKPSAAQIAQSAELQTPPPPTPLNAPFSNSSDAGRAAPVTFFDPVPSPAPELHKECIINTTDGPIDLTRLTQQEYHLTVSPCEKGFKFYFTTTFCESKVKHGSGDNTCPGQFGGSEFFALQMDEEASACQFAWNEMHEKPTAVRGPVPGIGENVYQVKYQYKGQQQGSQFPFNSPRYLTTTLICDMTLHDNDVKVVVSEVACTGRGLQTDPWHFNWAFRTRWACPRAPPSPPPPPPPIRDGALALVLFGVAIVVYLAAGFAYNKGVRKTSGVVNSIPNVQFWRELPWLVRDGVMYSYDHVRDTWRGADVPRIQVKLGKGPQPRTYTSI